MTTPGPLEQSSCTTKGVEADSTAIFGRLALDWLALDPKPCVMCTRALDLIWANAAALAELQSGADLAINDGRILARDDARQPALSRFVIGCRDELDTLAFPSLDGDGHLLLRGRQLRTDPQEPENGGSGDYVGIAFLRSGNGFKAAYADLEHAFQLTPAEYRVLSRMIEGLTAEGIAGAMALSIETVRSHIRQIYAKMGVASREAMFARIQPFRL